MSKISNTSSKSNNWSYRTNLCSKCQWFQAPLQSQTIEVMWQLNLCSEEKEEGVFLSRGVRFLCSYNMNNVNVKIKFRDCRNYINQMEKGCNFFKWLCDERLNGIFKLKNEFVHTRGLLKMLMVFVIFNLWLNVVFLTMYFK